MAGGAAIAIDYEFTFDDGETIAVDVRLEPDTLGLIRDQERTPPDWARRESIGCKVCELASETHEYCPVARNLVDVVERFGGHFSYQKVKVRVTTAERTVLGETTLQHGLSSLTGIYMVSSGCPTMNKLRPMVRFHLPFATLEETTYRAASMYLLAQFLRWQQGLEPDWSLDGLERIYADVHQVNLAVARCIRQAAARDANANALVRLDLFTDGVAFSIRAALDDLHYLYEGSYLPKEQLGS